MNLSIGLTTNASYKKVRWLATLAKETRLYRIWIGEDIDSLHNVFTLTSIFLLKTSFTKVGIGITSPLIRNITTIARAAAGLIELDSEERFILGLGIGGLQDLSKKGLVIKNPLQILRNANDILKRIWFGEKVTSKEGFVLDGYSARSKLKIPIYFGARGPKLLELAGEIADGVIISGPRSYLEKATNIVKKGLEKSKNPYRNFNIVVWLPTVLIKDGKGIAIAKEVVSIIISDTPKKVLELSGIDDMRIRKVRDAILKFGIKRASELVTEDLIRDFSISGNAQQICEELKSFKEFGVDEVVFGPPYGLNWQSSIVNVLEAWK
ncbi:MAG: LLM class flavin-dependent oxidoreductase [Candidatus Methylarchaceae archaeon HK02M2]|nr:LLM class flavin-dependent oxidoreductase [Candidatus Methylarchaceae archaeon HK02M2]